MLQKLHVASSIKELNNAASNINFEVSKVNAFIKAAKNLYENAKKSKAEDQEKSYILFMRYLYIFESIQKRKLNHEKDFNSVFSSDKITIALESCEKLANDLEERYKAKQEEEDAKQFLSERKKKDPVFIQPDQFTIKCLQLYKFINIPKKSVLFIDSRTRVDFSQSHIMPYDIINVPSDEINHKLALTASSLRKILKPTEVGFFDNRSQYDCIVLVDWEGRDNEFIPNSIAIIIKNALCKWSPDVSVKQVLMLSGGFNEWALCYPTLITSKNFSYTPDTSYSFSEIPDINFNYPNLEQSPRIDNSSTNLLDNITKPRYDRSKKPLTNVLNVSSNKENVKLPNQLLPNKNAHESILKDNVQDIVEVKSTINLPPDDAELSRLRSLKHLSNSENSELLASNNVSNQKNDLQDRIDKDIEKDYADKLVNSDGKKVNITDTRPTDCGNSDTGKTNADIDTEEIKQRISNDSTVNDVHCSPTKTTSKVDSLNDVKKPSLNENIPAKDVNYEPVRAKPDVDALRILKNNSKIDSMPKPTNERKPLQEKTSVYPSSSIENANAIESNVPIDRSSKPKGIDLDRMSVKNLNPVSGNLGIGVCGLKNLGNTCYMNSILQCLSHSPHVSNFFIQDEFTKFINTKNKHGGAGKMAVEFSRLLKAMHCGKYRILSPISFKTTLSYYNSIFKGTSQQDSQELLVAVLDGLHEDLNKVTNKVTIGDEDYSDMNDLEISERCWEKYLINNNSIIVKLFQGQLKSELRCLHCSKVSVTFDTFMYLSLPIPPKQSTCSLFECLKLFCLPDELEWKCPRCKVLRNSQKRIFIWNLPSILIIHFKRFNFQSGGIVREKIKSNITFPRSNLNLNSYELSPKKQNSYDLYGVSNHYGSIDGGHYIAYALNYPDHKWYKFDDDTVSSLSSENVVTSNAYILFYSCLKNS